MEEKTALVIYGSQSGNAQDLAEEVGEILQRLRFITRVIEMNECSPLDLYRYSFVQLVCSTTGQGAFPDNAREFWKRLLRRKLNQSSLEGVLYGLVGLGDSSYPQFNWAGRKLERRLSQLGARSVVPTCELNDSAAEGPEGIITPWLEVLQEQLREFFVADEIGQVADHHMFLEPPWSLALADEDAITNGNDNEFHGSQGNGDIAQWSSRVEVKVIKNHRVTPDDHFQDVRLLQLSANARLDMQPGDAVGVKPSNARDDVEAFLNLVYASSIADRRLKLHISQSRFVDIPKPFTESTERLTLRTLAMHQLDLNSIPRRSFLRRLAYFATDDAERERLIELGSAEFIEEYYDYVTRPRRTILEVIQDFRSVEIPWKYVANIIPLMHVRWFSVARFTDSEVLKTDRELQRSDEGTVIDLLLAIVDYQTVIRKRRKGVCTSYLAEIEPGKSLQVSYQKSTLINDVADYHRPAIMIGTGTGIAPLRALLWERRRHANDVQAPVLLFFGNRNEQADFFFRDEWDELAKQVPIAVFPTFSRDQTQKIYVQDRLRQEGRAVWDTIDQQQGLVYVCGSSGKMPAGVRQALEEIFQREGRMSADEASRYFLNLIEAKRYKQETW